MTAALSAQRLFDVVVAPEIRDFFLEVEVNGNGGFQRLVRLLAERLEVSRTLHLTAEEFQRIVRYATEYGDGGYQLRLRKIVCSWVAQHMDDVVG